MTDLEQRHLFNFVSGSDITGESTFDIWRRLGNESGTAEEFIEYIKSGPQGPQGNSGKSAYEEWLTIEGNEGKTLTEFYEYLKGTPGECGKSAYEQWLTIDGNEGKTIEEFYEYLKGPCGNSAYQDWLTIQGNEGKTLEEFMNSLHGKNGESTYEIWTSIGNTGSAQDFLDSLKGSKGDTGVTGPKGDTGAKGDTGVSITSVEQTTISSADDGTNVITVTLSDGTSSTFNIKNGSKGSTGDTGPQGEPGESTYEVWKNLGNQGDAQDFLDSLKGDKGDNANITGAASTIAETDLTASRALVSDSSGKVAVSAVTATELGYLDGVTSAIQAQINAKAPTNNPTFTGTSTFDIINVLTKFSAPEGSVSNKFTIGNFILSYDTTNDRLVISHS